MTSPTHPFSSVLIANRGEIALRLVRACRELGLKSVVAAVGSEKDALPAREADAIAVLESPKSYLDPKALLEAAKKTKAGAIHPGYGFLSENADFAEAVISAGLTWIGPPPAAMRALGNKLAGRAVAEKASVPVLPGAKLGKDPAKAAKEVGFPLLVKAADGGGGRGQRMVEKPSQLTEAIESARREAGASFASEEVFLERFLPAPRHVEFQILGDPKGKVVHLHERECSVQRRRQKLIEESPSPALTPELRERMGAAAVRLAEAAGYRSLGTVEFLVDGKDFYFLEVNARLQVEHPVTEAVLGLDLAQWQIRMAMGEPFPFSQAQIQPRGHAIEARLCAEDPDHDFLPSGGRILALDLPRIPGLRWETFLEEGREVASDYDSLLGKAVAWAEDRAGAIRRLDQALAGSVLLGLHQNLGFLRFVLGRPEFSSGKYDTGLVEERILAAWVSRNRDLPPEAKALIAEAKSRPIASGAGSGRRIPDPWQDLNGWKP